MALTMKKTPKGPVPKRPKLPAGKAEGEREHKGERIRRLVAAESWHGAFKLAASFDRVAEPYKTAIQRAWQAIDKPEFTRALGRDPEALIAAGKAALRHLYVAKKGATR